MAAQRHRASRRRPRDRRRDRDHPVARPLHHDQTTVEDPAQGGPRQLDRQRPRVLRLLHLRDRRRARLRRRLLPRLRAGTATLLSLATFGVGYAARPIGAFFMGHLGDRYGRKRVLVLTMLADGDGDVPRRLPARPTTTSGILAPDPARHPPAGAGLRRVRRAGRRELVQPRARPRRAAARSSRASRSAARRPASSSPRPTWLPIGALPDDQLQSWGWRVPFWLSAIVVRRGPRHPPPPRGAARASGQTRGRDAQRPARRPPARPPRQRRPRDARLRWPRPSARSSPSTRSSFAVDTVGLDKTTMLWVAIVTNLVALVAIPLWAASPTGSAASPSSSSARSAAAR